MRGKISSSRGQRAKFAHFSAFLLQATQNSWLVQIILSESLTGTNSSGISTPSGGGEFDLVLSTSYLSPTDLLAAMNVPNSQGIIHFNFDGAGSYSESQSAFFLVNGGASFYLAGVLSVGADGNQVMDFSRSAHFGITGPDSVSLVTDSGTTYPNAISEPASLSLLAFGVAGLGFSRRKKI